MQINSFKCNLAICINQNITAWFFKIVVKMFLNMCKYFIFFSTQYGTKALDKITKAILGYIENKVPPPKGYPGGEARFFAGCNSSFSVCHPILFAFSLNIRQTLV